MYKLLTMNVPGFVSARWDSNFWENVFFFAQFHVWKYSINSVLRYHLDVREE